MTASQTLQRPGPPPAPGQADARIPAVPPRRSRRPVALIAASLAVACVLALPLVFLLIEARGAGAASVSHLIFRRLTVDLLWNTVRLTVVVTILCAVIGTAAAWCVERTNLPGRRVWAVLVVVPLAIPDFVVSFGWASLWTWVQGFRGAVVVMTLAVYPLVYLPVAASLRAADPGQEEVARSLGVGRVRTFARVTLAQARGAILGGCLLVAMVLLAEYGAFEILGYQTFTTEIFTEFNVSFSIPAACALSLVLVLLSLLVLAGEGMLRGRGRVTRGGPLAARRRHPAGPGRFRGADRAGARRPGRRERVLDIRGRRTRDRRRVPVRRRAAHRDVRDRGRDSGHGGGAADSAAGAEASWPAAAPAGTQHLPRAGHARCGRRVRPVVFCGTLRERLSLPERATFGRLLRDHVLPAGPGRRQGVAFPRAGQPGRDGQVPGPAQACGALAGDATAGRAGAGCRVLPGLPVGGDGTDGHAAAGPHRSADARDPVLGLRDQPVLRSGRAVRAGDDRRSRGAELRARQVLRPLGACADVRPTGNDSFVGLIA